MKQPLPHHVNDYLYYVFCMFIICTLVNKVLHHVFFKTRLNMVVKKDVLPSRYLDGVVFIG